MSRKKLAVILMNLGGPDKLANIRPFLYNLFSDPAIIALPSPFRQILAKFISNRRAKKAREIYEKLGGKSPLLGNTQQQQIALESVLKEQLSEWDVRVFIAMRYWHPMTQETTQQVRQWGADLAVSIPLYPQFSTTTTESSFNIWHDLAPALRTIDQGCYFQNSGFIKAYQQLISQALADVPKDTPIRLLFSAHGIPEKLIQAGDPYQWQVEQSVTNVMQAFAVDYRICYQSRVGPLKWIGPNLEDEITQAVQDDVGVVVVPISFVSEHSETLVELDIDFKFRANKLDIKYYGRVPALGTHPLFIQGLADLIADRVRENRSYDAALCPENFVRCGCR